ncbi:MAG: hypothetical protein P1V20_26405, partial [Verrucomicrobiales bacterium]|nr:hypothetical protein [Verrucomicrobiales bacterium]
DIDDVTINEATQDESGLSIYLTPMSFSDNLYCLAEKQPAVMTFNILNETSVKVDRPVIVMGLPQGIRVVEGRTPIKLVNEEDVMHGSNKYTRYRFDVSDMKYGILRDKIHYYHAYHFLLTNDLVVSEKVLPAFYSVEDGDSKSSVKEFGIKIINDSKSVAPKRFESGAVLSREFDYLSEEAVSLSSRYYAGKGCNVIHIGEAPKPVMMSFQNTGIKRYWQPTQFLVNGYTIGSENKPDSVRFQLIDGTYYNNAICPMEVITEGSYYRSSVEEPLRNVLVKERLADDIMPNWEPYDFDFKGCFCQRCKQDFTAYSNLEAAHVDAMWPGEIINQHRETWIKFRSWQHGRMMGVFEKSVNKIGREAGLEAHFTPEVSSWFFTEGGKLSGRQYRPEDYIEKLAVIEPWGPYIGMWRSRDNYKYQCGEHLKMYEDTRQIHGRVAELVPDVTKRPKLIGFPHGYQSVDIGMTIPEGIYYDTLSCFVNGWDGALTYLFPCGYDARYWNALADANRAISRFEDIVLDGNAQQKHSIKATSPQPKVNISNKYRENDVVIPPDTPLIRCNEFSLGEKRLFVISNAWQYSDTFVKLKINDTKSGQSYVLHEPLADRHYSMKAGSHSLTSTELAAGLQLHAGALDFRFFVLEAFDATSNYGELITAKQVEMSKQAHLPLIQNAIEFENKYQ